MIKELELDPETQDLIIKFDEHELEELGWSPGDNLIWTQIDETSWRIEKKG